MDKRAGLAAGFTTMELLMCVLILSALIALAFPRMMVVIEKNRSGEAVQLLRAVMNAEEVLKFESGVYTDDINDLDIEMPASGLKYFGNPAFTLAGNEVTITLTRTGSNNYTLSLDSVGNTLTCSGGSGSICNKMGY